MFSLDSRKKCKLLKKTQMTATDVTRKQAVHSTEFGKFELYVQLRTPSPVHSVKSALTRLRCNCRLDGTVKLRNDLYHVYLKCVTKLRQPALLVLYLMFPSGFAHYHTVT